MCNYTDNTFEEVEGRLNKCCDQMAVLLDKIASMQARLKRAKSLGNVLLVQSLDMQLKVLKNMYNMYYQYAENRADELHYAAAGMQLRE